MSDPYSFVGGRLRLKGIGGKKKKKKKNSAKKYIEQIANTSDSVLDKKTLEDNRTAAQKAFDKIREKRQEEKILEKAQKKHKDHVEDFNRRLDQLSEHFDIPKVSWTK